MQKSLSSFRTLFPDSTHKPGSCKGRMSLKPHHLLIRNSIFTSGISLNVYLSTGLSAFSIMQKPNIVVPAKETVQETSLGCVTCGTSNPLNPPCQGDLSLNSPLIRGARGVRKDEYWIFAQSRKQEPSKTAKSARVFRQQRDLERVSCTVSQAGIQ